MNAKILVAAPTFKGMQYCHDAFFEGLSRLTYENFDVLIVDNSRDYDYFKTLQKIPDITVIHDDTKEEKSVMRLISSRNKILEYASNHPEYTHVFMLDSDVIPPANILETLLAWKKDIVSGLYDNYFNISGKRRVLPVAWKYLTPEEFEELQAKYPLGPQIKTREDIKRHITPEEVASKTLHEVAIPSAGCMLIARSVFEDIRYGKFVKEGFTSHGGDDVHFIEEARKKGFTPFVDTSMKCAHDIKEKYKRDEQGNYVHQSFADLV